MSAYLLHHNDHGNDWAIRVKEDGALYHSFKGTKWRKHKYISKEQTAAGGINYIYKKAEKVYDDLTKDNELITNNYNYAKNIEQIKNSDEWKDIVKRKDPEYVTKDKNGNTVYKIDDYLVKKKHPVIDALDDLANGRPASFNKITKKSVVAGSNDYLKSYIQMLGIASMALTEKFKVSQGSYSDKQKQMNDTVQQGQSFLNSLLKTYDLYNKKK